MTSVYAAILLAHSWVRWAVLVALVISTARAAHGWFRRRPFSHSDERVVRLLLGLVDTQLLLGLSLYGGVSPIVRAALGDIGGAVSSPVLRFFILEHPVAMLSGITILHVGLLRAKRLGSDPERHRSVLRTTAAAMTLFLAAIPWPGLAYSRPLLRW